MKNVWIVVVLVLIGGLIVWLSTVIQPISTPSEKPAVAESQKAPEAQPVSAPQPVAAKAEPSPSRKQLDDIFNKGLKYFVSKQLSDGAFPDLEGKSDVAFTAMGLIILAESPEDTRKQYQVQIVSAVNYILPRQEPTGAVIDAKKFPAFEIYKTSLALVALKTVQPFMEKSVADRIEPVVKKATDYLTKSQYGPESADKDFGGWGYDEKKGNPNANLSTTAYAMDALHLAGLAKDSDTYKRAVEFLAKIQDSSEYNKFRATENTGGFAYSPVESKGGEKTTPDGKKVLVPYGSMTYAGLKSFIYAYIDKNDPRVQAAYNWIRLNYTLDENPGLRTDAEPNLGKQGLFYYYHTFAKSLDAYGEKTLVTADPSVVPAGKKEHLWANELVDKLAVMQKPDGSWSNEVSRWWEDFAPLATSYSLMSLNICRKWTGD
ncbi:MAG: prenyltransferase/squalene oxidase repeat-containing protein [Candidatus Brocadiia bacterium]